MTATPSLSEHVAREIRIELARSDITQSEFARRCGWTSSTLSRRMTGEIPWNTDELEIVAKMLGLPLHELTTAVRR